MVNGVSLTMSKEVINRDLERGMKRKALGGCSANV